MYGGSETNHRTKDCPIYLETKKKMEQDSTQPSHQSAPEKSTTPCNGLHTISNILHPIVCIIQPKPTKIAKPNLQHITKHTTTPPPTIINLH
jgi:hypothetical protein